MIATWLRSYTTALVGMTAGFSLFAFIGAPESPPHRGCHSRAPVVVDEFEFGATDGVHFTDMSDAPGVQVERVEGQGFGWSLHVDTPRDTVRVTEILTLPSAPEVWQVPASTRILDDGRIAVTHEVVDAPSGWLMHEWAVSEGDPAGTYRFEILLDGQLAKTFEVEVVDPAPQLEAHALEAPADEAHKGCGGFAH